jgi:hypothetical protein
MAKRKAPELSPEAQAANAAGEAKREKEKRSRLKNAEKQKRFRDNMKEAAYKRVTLWDLPGPAHKRMADKGYKQTPAWETPAPAHEKPDKKKICLAVRICESSLNIAARSPEVREALKRAFGSFSTALDNSPDKLSLVRDFQALIKILGDPWGEE